MAIRRLQARQRPWPALVERLGRGGFQGRVAPLTTEEGVLTPAMAAHVLRDKADREAKRQRAMEFWQATPASALDSPLSSQ